MRYFIKQSPLHQGDCIIECDAGDGRWLAFPPTEENPDYQQYLKWLAEGNTPEEWSADAD